MANTHTQKFINQQKKKLEEELQKIQQQLQKLKADDPFSDPDYASDNAAVDTDVREQDYHAINEAQSKELQKRSKEIQMALDKINKGRYGYCQKCGKTIPEARLELVPEAIYCVEDEAKMRK
jgi:RNA polymerase-binding transcription factor DksA